MSKFNLLLHILLIISIIYYIGTNSVDILIYASMVFTMIIINQTWDNQCKLQEGQVILEKKLNKILKNQKGGK